MAHNRAPARVRPAIVNWGPGFYPANFSVFLPFVSFAFLARQCLWERTSHSSVVGRAGGS